MSVQGLGEVILYVRDMSLQVAFYRDKLGLALLYADKPNDLQNCYWVVFDTGACKLALHGGGSCSFGEDAPKIVFFVDDIEQDRELLLRRGIELQEIFSPAPGVFVCNGRDSEGNKLSLESCR